MIESVGKNNNYPQNHPSQYPIYHPSQYPIYHPSQYPFYGKMIQPNYENLHDVRTLENIQNVRNFEDSDKVISSDNIQKIENEKNKISSEKEEDDNISENCGKVSYLLIGLLLGTILDFFTVLIMVTIGILIENRRFRMLNSMRPQEIIITFIKTLVKTCINLSMK